MVEIQELDIRSSGNRSGTVGFALLNRRSSASFSLLVRAKTTKLEVNCQ